MTEAAPALSEQLGQDKSNDTSSAPDYLNLIPEEMKSDPNVTKFKSVTEIIKAYKNLQSDYSKKVRIPDEMSEPSAKQEFYDKVSKIPGIMRIPEDDKGIEEMYNKLGRPEKPEQYKLDLDGTTLEQLKPTLDNFLPYAHKLGLTSKQADGVVKFTLEQDKIMKQQFEVAKEHCKSTLKSQWGDEYDSKLRSADSLLQQYAAKGYKDQVTQIVNGLSTNPVLVMMLVEQAESYQEKGHLPRQPYGGDGMTPERAQEEIDRIYNLTGKARKEHPYFNVNSESHNREVEKVQQYFALINKFSK